MSTDAASTGDARLIAGGADGRAGPQAGESVPADEAAAVATIVRSIEQRVRAAARDGKARRDAHPKAHGCVRASFEVLADLPQALRAGIFAAPRRFDSLIRFSNGSETPRADAAGDGRGMAIKILGVAGSRSTTQDFIMINNPAFFVRTAADYVAFQTAAPAWRFFLPGLNPFHWRVHEFFVARAITGRVIANPLDARYWSMTPYLLGEIACKFSARPAGAPSSFNATESADFLRENLAGHLRAASATFDFMLQPRTRPESMPIEDPTIAWDESAAPFVPVARITIPPQIFDTPEQRSLGETLSFTPWHGLDAHRPLGGINRVRRTVYETISRLRHELNNEARAEPAAVPADP